MAGWKDILRTIVPSVGNMLGGPLGGMATKFIAETLLGKPDASEEELEQAVLNATPEQLLKLKQSERDFKTKMKELGIDEFSLEIEDRKSAREMFKFNMWPQVCLSGLFITGYFAVLILMLIKGLKMSSDFMLVFGVITAAIPMILQFWFGSSTGSKEKTAKLKPEKA